jgi:hypothetical protein
MALLVIFPRRPNSMKLTSRSVSPEKKDYVRRMGTHAESGL